MFPVTEKNIDYELLIQLIPSPTMKEGNRKGETERENNLINECVL